MPQMFQNLDRTLEPGQTLKITCGHCGHGAEWDHHEAHRLLGPRATPADCRRRLVCGHCGDGKAVNVWI